MRILILSGNTGGGHNSAAMAIKDYFSTKNAACEIRDALAFWSEGKSYLISNGHILIYKKAPKLFWVIYRFAEKHPAKENDESFMYDVVTRGAKGLNEFLEENQFDAIICTHVFAGMIATAVKKKYRPNLKIYFIATDYTCSPGVSEILMDGCFIPHEKLREEFLKNRVKKEIIVASGIPVRAKFYEHTEPKKAKEMLSLPTDKKLVLLMCGSMGCGPMKGLTKLLENTLPDDTHIAVICGSNKKLLKELSKRDQSDKVTLIGYTDKMALYMDAADVALTKPGGLSTSEALTKGVPLLLIDAVPGCETRNIEFLCGNHFAETGNNADELTALVFSFIGRGDKAQKTRELLRKEFSDNAAQKIYDYIAKDL